MKLLQDPAYFSLEWRIIFFLPSAYLSFYNISLHHSSLLSCEELMRQNMILDLLADSLMGETDYLFLFTVCLSHDRDPLISKNLVHDFCHFRLMFVKYHPDQIMISIPQSCASQYHHLWY